MSDFENEGMEEIEFAALEKLQFFHEDSKRVLVYAFGRNDFAHDKEKNHFLLKKEIAQQILAELEKEYHVKLNLDLTDVHVDLLVFLDLFMGDEISASEPKFTANIFVVEDFNDLELVNGAWEYLSLAEFQAQQELENFAWFRNADDGYDEYDDEYDDKYDDYDGEYDESPPLSLFDDTMVEQLEEMMSQGETSKELLEKFMNQLVLDMLESRGNLSDGEALQKFLDIVQKRVRSSEKTITDPEITPEQKESDDDPDPKS
jgi:hypothetical protein